MLTHFKIIFLFLVFIGACNSPADTTSTSPKTTDVLAAKGATPESKVIKGSIQLAANRSELYLPLLSEKRVGLVVNQTSMTDNGHLVDYLVGQNILVNTIFAPEHGFRGKADAGEKVKDGKDVKTGLPIISLYGKNKKPSAIQLKNMDVVIFDIQDVGARFYTYISTMNYVMEACAENGVPVIVLDRPNPNGHYIDGPILEKGFESFVGMNKVPVVHGMTVGEYAQMLNGEKMLANGVQCDLTVIPCANYSHDIPYELPVRPSPNLPNQRSIYLYPSLCFFEGTNVSVGRGTDYPFQIIGHPKLNYGKVSFTPKPNFGAKYPKHQGVKCNGQDFTEVPLEDLRNQRQINLEYLIQYHELLKGKEAFFLKNKFIDKLAGTDQLRLDIIAGKTADEIRTSWQEDLTVFKNTRKKYLLYPDFE